MSLDSDSEPCLLLQNWVWENEISEVLWKPERLLNAPNVISVSIHNHIVRKTQHFCVHSWGSISVILLSENSVNVNISLTEFTLHDTWGSDGSEDFDVGLLCCNAVWTSVPGQGWVGWRNDTRNGQPIEIKFEFDKVREFTSVHIFCNNQFTRDVQVSTCCC
jgi:hypothetical protein